MRPQLTLAILAFFMLFLFSSCQKTDIIENEQTLEGTWMVTNINSDRAYDFNGDGRTETDIYGTYSSCQRDIVVVFDASRYGQMRQGCDAPWQNITWRLSSGNRQLDIRLPDDELNLSISQFDDATLRGTDRVTLNGSTYNIAYTFQRR